MQNTEVKIEKSCDYISSDRFYFECLISQIFVLLLISLYAVALGNPSRLAKGFDPDSMSHLHLYRLGMWS